MFPDGRRVVSGSHDKTLKLWGLPKSYPELLPSYPELAGVWRPARHGQWTRPHQARDRRTVERWDADGRCQYQTEHDRGFIVVVSKMGDEYRCRGESGGACYAPQLIMRTNADGTHSWDLGAWGVEHWQNVAATASSGGRNST